MEHLFRQQSGKMSAILTRIFGFSNTDLVEDILQETFLSAMKTWGMKGEPENPEGWLMLVAKNKIINELNRRKRHAEKREKIHYETAEEKIEELFLDHEIKDSQLRVLFACCHPDLSPRSQIMLTLKVLSGFGDREIASALLMSPEAVKKGIYRSRQQLKNDHDYIGIPFLSEVNDRIDTVLTIIYLIFNEGYKASVGDTVIDEELCYESIRLVFLLKDIPDVDQGEVYALLALMYLTLARFPSRITKKGELVEIENQDRSKWDKELIDAGVGFLKKSRESNKLSRYHLESTIAAVHFTSPSYEQTDWGTIVFCYERLMKKDDSFMIRLNHAIALGKLKEAETGLSKLKELEKDAPSGKRGLLFAAIAEINLRIGNFEVAKSYYQVSLDLSKTPADSEFLARKIMECDKKNINKN